MSLELDLTGNVVAYLRSAISDPLGGSSRGWIYPGYPRKDATMPRIGIIGTGSPPADELGLGNHGKIYRFTRNAVINVDSRTVADIGGQKYSGQKLLAYLVSKVKDVIDKNRGSLQTSYGWIDAHTDPTIWGGFDEVTDIHEATVPIWVEIVVSW